MDLKTKSGQILIITLLVLTIIAIIVVSLVGLVNRDIQQVVSTEQYEEAYNTSETQLKKVLDVYGKPNTTLSEIINTFNSPSDISCNETDLVQKIYTCGVISSEFSDVPLRTTIVAKDTNKVTDFPIYKDRTFDMGLDGYLDIIEFWWDKYAAIEFILTYSDANGVQSVRDVYDPDAVIYNSFSLSVSPPIHTFNFRAIPGRSYATSVAINISEIITTQSAGTASPVSVVGSGGTPISLQIIPRMNDRFDSILLNAQGNNTLKDQIREFTSSSYNEAGGASTPVASIETKIPLAPQPDSILDYAIITDGTIQNQ